MTATDDGIGRAETAVTLASQSTVVASDDQNQAPSSVVCELPTLASDGARSILNLTELGNAKRLVTRFGTFIRYVPTWKKWLVWDGQRWAIDLTGEVHRYAKKTIRLIYTEAANTSSDEQRRTLADHAKHSEAAARMGLFIHGVETIKREPYLIS